MSNAAALTILFSPFLLWIGFLLGRMTRRDGDYARGKRDGEHEGFMRGVEAVRKSVCG